MLKSNISQWAFGAKMTSYRHRWVDTTSFLYYVPAGIVFTKSLMTHFYILSIYKTVETITEKIFQEYFSLL